MRKAMTLRALPLALGASMLPFAAVTAQDTTQPPSEMPSSPDAQPAPDNPPTPDAPPAPDNSPAPDAPDAPPAPGTGQTSSAAAAPATGEAPRTNANIVQIAEANAAFSTLVTAVKAADLAGPLSGPGPITVFAPSNDAFARLPAGTVDELVKPANKAKLTGVLTYHVVSGEVTSADIAQQIEAGGGKATLTTMNGATLTASMDGNAVVLTDAKGGKSRVVVADVLAANGIIHAVDAVAMP